MTTARKGTWEESWNDFKKSLTPDNIKMLISGAVPGGLGIYAATFWIKLIVPLLASNGGNPTTPHQALIFLCVLIGFIAPLYPLCVWSAYLGLWIGKATKFYKDDKTITLLFDDVGYSIKDMPQDERNKIIDILSSYKSKEQLRKEKRKHLSWLRRTFT